MFTLDSHGGSHPAGRGIADAQAHEVHHEPAGPLDGELLDLYAAILIIVPLALFLKSFLF
jgi:hypothetical protein